MDLLCTAVYDPQKALRILLIPWSLPKPGGGGCNLVANLSGPAGSCAGVWEHTELWGLLRWLQDHLQSIACL